MVISSQPAKAKSIPYIAEQPFLGSYQNFMKERLHFLERLAQHNDVCGFHLGPVVLFLFNKPEHVQTILVDRAYDFSKGTLMHKAIKGNGLFVSEGDFHRKQRKVIAPLFQPRHIAQYADTIVHYSKQVTQSWSDHSIIDINQQMIALTPGQHIEPDSIHNLALRPGGRVEVVVQRV